MPLTYPNAVSIIAVEKKPLGTTGERGDRKVGNEKLCWSRVGLDS